MLNLPPKTKLFLDFSDVEFFYPAGINILTLIGYYLMSKKSFKIRQNLPTKKEVNDFLSISGFKHFVGLKNNKDVKKTNSPNETYKIRRFDWVNDNEIDNLIKMIETELKMSLNVKSRIFENIAELIMNVVQHSSSPFDCFVIGQAYPRSHNIRYCIGDAGIGIKNHLSNNYPDLAKKNSCEAIKLSLQDGVTGNKSGENIGAGLYDLTNLVKLCGGSFIILSGDGFYEEIVKYDNNKMKTEINEKKLNFIFQGTFIDIRLESKPNLKVFQKGEKIPKKYRLIRKR